MKSLSKKTIVTASILTLIAVPSVAYAAVNYMDTNDEQPTAVAQQVIPQETEPVTDTKQEPVVEKVTEPEKTAVAQVAEPVEQEPVVLSTQEYADKYLDMSLSQAKTCLDMITQQWPERFLPYVREENVKALRIFGNPCSAAQSTHANYSKDIRYSLIYRYGKNGEFFDSSMADAGRNIN